MAVLHTGPRDVGADSVLSEGRNAWRIARSAQGAFLIDANEYFEDLYRAMARAERSIFIIGWDIANDVRLVRDRRQKPYPKQLGPFLNALVVDKPNLHVYVLAWDYSTVFVFDREKFTFLRLGVMSHARISFELDDQHPVGGSHHQKFVVIDDAVAYCGGLDLTTERWDTPDHAPNDRRRHLRNNKKYRPFHDVQLKVSGEAARAFGDLARDRWLHATGRRVEPGPLRPVSAVYAGRVDFRDLPVALSRTEPAFKARPRVHEVETLYIDLIEGATTTIYIENQYFTARGVAAALRRSLERESGPEIVVVVPAQPTGWIEERTLWEVRNDLVRQLEDSDRHGRFKAYTPAYPNDPEADALKVHSKVMIVDDRYARVGSANLSNRSMGLDFECDATIDAGTDETARRAVRRFRARLLAEHISTPAEGVLARFERGIGMRALIASAPNASRTLVPLEADRKQTRDIPAEMDFVDLEKPMPVERLTDQLYFQIRDNRRAFTRSPFFIVGSAIGALILMAVFLTMTPLGALADVEFFDRALGATVIRRFGSAAVLGAFALGALLFIPINLLIIATATIYDFWTAMGLIAAGSAVNAAIGYGAGFLLGEARIQRLFSRKLPALMTKLRHHGTLSIVLVRMFPIATFSSVNLICGATRVPLHRFIAGTLLGLAPGALALTIFLKSLLALAAGVSVKKLIIFSVISLITIFGFGSLRRRFSTD